MLVGHDSGSGSKTRFRFAGYACRPLPNPLFGRLQSCARLIPGTLVLRSKIGLDNRFLPRSDGLCTVAYLLLALWFYLRSRRPDLRKVYSYFSFLAA